jgi:drug/metabolite transporter (DMT)-like permease
MILGTLPLLPVGGPGLLAVPWRSLGPGTWLLLAYLSVGTIVVGYVLWYWALARTSTARVVVYSYLTPVVAAVISIALGQDTPSVALAVGRGGRRGRGGAHPARLIPWGRWRSR